MDMVYVDNFVSFDLGYVLRFNEKILIYKYVILLKFKPFSLFPVNLISATVLNGLLLAMCDEFELIFYSNIYAL